MKMGSRKPINWLLSIKNKCELRTRISAHIFIFCFALINNSAISQNQNSLWCFGDSAGINFSDTANLATFSTALDTRGSCVSIADSTGQLLFYANTRATLSGYTTRVWNKMNQLMDGGDTIIGRGWYNELIIIPFPGSTSKYYLFTAGVTSFLGLYYSVIDMNENGGLGKVIQKNVSIHSYETWDGLTAIKHANGRDWWLITKDNRSGSPNGSNVFTKYLITDIGITEMLQPSGNFVYGNSCTMTFSKSGAKFLFTTLAGLIEVFDFDRCSGLFSNPIIVTGVRLSGIILTIGSAFSPNENVIYVSQNDTTSYLFQYDLQAPNIDASKDTLSIIPSPKVAAGSLRLAPDDKVYWSCVWNNGVSYNYPYADTMYHTENMNLSVINTPDALGSACNFSLYGFYLGGKRTYWGLPNNPDYTMGAVAGSVCDSLSSDISEVIRNNSLYSLYPNPSLGKVLISFSEKNFGNAEIQIIDVTGRVVLKNKLFVIDQEIDLSFLTNGVYVVKISVGGVYKDSKLIKY